MRGRRGEGNEQEPNGAVSSQSKPFLEPTKAAVKNDGIVNVGKWVMVAGGGGGCLEEFTEAACYCT